MRIITRSFDRLENWIYGISAIFLVILSLIIYLYAIYEFIRDFQEQNVIENVLRFIEHILLALVLAGLIHTIKITLRSKKLRLEPYLIVGIIASIRRIIILTVRVSKVMNEQQSTQDLQYTIYEIIVLSVVTILLAISIKIIHKYYKAED